MRALIPEQKYRDPPLRSHLAGPVQQHVDHGITAEPDCQPPPTAVDAPLGDPASKSHGEGRCKVWRGGAIAMVKVAGRLVGR